VLRGGPPRTGDLAARGVDTSMMQVDPERETGEVEITMSGAEPRFRLVPGRAWERIETTAEVRAAVHASKAFVFGTFAMRTPEGFASWRESVEAVSEFTIRVCDPNLRPNAIEKDALAAMIEVVDVLKVGERELAQIEKLLGRKNLLDWLLLKRNPAARVVAITRGAAGSTLHTCGERVEVPAFPAAPGGDNIGCGDAYTAVLAHGLVQRWPLGDIAAVAARWSARVASVRGACPDLDDAEIASLLADRIGVGAA
jgi:fructokinase